MRLFFYVLSFLFCQSVLAQDFPLNFDFEKLKNYSVWQQENKMGLDLNEVAFVNWNTGGTNSISAILDLETSLNYYSNHLKWANKLSARYGINKQQEESIKKTDDLLEVDSSLGYRKDTLTNWSYSAKLNFKSQITHGYNYPDRSHSISKFMAPGYLFFGTGMEYGKTIEKFSMYMSPMTIKCTFVLDDELANNGDFGVEPAVLDEEGNVIKEGENIRSEIGFLVRNYYEANVVENVGLKNEISLYTDYINDFGNVDVNWKLAFDFKVNDFIKATLGSHLKYDNDTKTQVKDEETDAFLEKGPKVQWKQQIGVGVIWTFS